MPNRLALETSPYLRQHKDNPVDWFPWGDEAFQRARDENKPVFLSIGYSSCHWCHVMAHESFENEAIAELLNDRFVSVKVDREELPDVDDTYMTAVQMSAGHGGWPMSVFLTPSRKPFFAGTYFPAEDHGRNPGFRSLLSQIAALWLTRQRELESTAEEFAQAIAGVRAGVGAGGSRELDANLVEWASDAVSADFDAVHGGFGGAPKFPPHAAIQFLLFRGTPADRQMAFLTLEKMALGGIHDHVGGGFHRYSTDDHWLLPHFEKMLYDNALMLGNYANASRLADDPRLASLFHRTAHGIVSWLEREMLSPEGLFYAALDADSEGEEGRFYLWDHAEVRNALRDATPFLEAFNVSGEGNYRDEATGRLTGLNVLHLSCNLGATFDDQLATLRRCRDRRVRPATDDKALVGWNGLAIGALADAGYVELAIPAAAAILRAEAELGHLPRQITRGVASGHGYLEDFAFFADGLQRLAKATDSSSAWRDHAERIASQMKDLFYDPEGGGFFSTCSQHEVLFGRSKPVMDNPIPSANAVAIRVFRRLGDQETAVHSMAASLFWVERAPTGATALLSEALAMVDSWTGEALVRVSIDTRGPGSFVVHISIAPGWHIGGPDGLVPTTVTAENHEIGVQYPDAPLDRYEGEVELLVNVANADGVFELTLRYQACTETECALPQEAHLRVAP